VLAAAQRDLWHDLNLRPDAQPGLFTLAIYAVVCHYLVVLMLAGLGCIAWTQGTWCEDRVKFVSGEDIAKDILCSHFSSDWTHLLAAANQYRLVGEPAQLNQLLAGAAPCEILRAFLT
jgi:hypothetical protein